MLQLVGVCWLAIFQFRWRLPFYQQLINFSQAFLNRLLHPSKPKNNQKVFFLLSFCKAQYKRL